MPDIDIDFQSSFEPSLLINQAVRASMVKNMELVKHPCGYYFQDIPVDNITNLAAIPYDIAEDLGFFKIDFLHLSLLDNFSTKNEIKQLLKKEPQWDILIDPVHTEKLFQLHNNYKLLQQIMPASVEELADCIALIRPSKAYMINNYVNTPKTNRYSLRSELYQKPANGKNWFKRAHAIAYALTIVLQLHLISLNRL